MESCSELGKPGNPIFPSYWQAGRCCKDKFAFVMVTCTSFTWLQYADKAFVQKIRDIRLVAHQIWEAVRTNDKKAVYRLIVSSEADLNAVCEEAVSNSSLTLAKAMLLQEQSGIDHKYSYLEAESLGKLCSSSSHMASTSRIHMTEDLSGCSLLHLACETADIGMLELLLQYGVNINASDSRGQTALHRCVMRGKAPFVKLLLSR